MRNRNKYKLSAIALALTSSLTASGAAFAQEEQEANNDTVEVIEVSGIRSSLTKALAEKRAENNVVEIIQSDDIGKLPDQNLAEVLENVTGIQITRTAGIGTAVQIRGTDENRVEINGVSSVGSGAGRGGISFEDLPAALISSVEVTKAPQAKTIEGSVGGTINLRTLRPLELTQTVFAVRAKAQNSDLDVDNNYSPILSGTYGDNWSTDNGEMGVVFSLSYAEQNVSAFRPRADRDGLVSAGQNYDADGRAGEASDRIIGSAEDFDFLRIQFFNQDYDILDYETTNLSASFEWAPNDKLKLYVDALLNDQERTQESTEIQFSGVSDIDVVDITTNTSFETVNFGSIDTPNGVINIPSIQAVTSGVLLPDALLASGLNPNIRTRTNTGARLTDSSVIRIGGEWTEDDYVLSAEYAISQSDTVTPDFAVRLDFINPLSAQPVQGGSIDNGTPVEFDLRGGTLQFGIAQGLPTSPTTAMLLDPANYALSQAQQVRDIAENKETAFRTDFTYYLDGAIPFVTSVDAGYRYNETSTLNNDFSNSRVNLTSASSEFDRPRGTLFSNLLVPGSPNFNAADGRRLFVRDFLIVNPALSYSDPETVAAAINAAIVAASDDPANPGETLGAIEQDESAFFDISEETHALYAQANFESDVIRGSFGLRYISTELESIGLAENDGVFEQVRETSDYNFVLPRLNVVADIGDDIVVRGAIGRDINRPDFDDLSTSTRFTVNANAPVQAGNPRLVPEDIWSLDLAVEYYFAPSSVVSAGIFYKKRKDLFIPFTEDPPGNVVDGVLNIDITAPCEDGGIFNPVADRNINNPTPGEGICVPFESTFNGNGDTTQKGIELAFQYDLSEFEDDLGWASGFGVVANYTYQDADSGDDFRSFNSRGQAILEALGIAEEDAQDRVELSNLSKNAYNFTVFYEKFGVSARARYTWRSAYIANDAFQFGLPRVNEARGQLNASINYAVNEQFTLGIEGINITQSDAEQSCVNEGALLCFQGLTDRRILLGGSYRF
ncbi:TonB-dependent receptor [Glaciecola sp. MH2013]|uniref:TonB-dependent receptor n=1 Tax=Glaciecola sp. MH2013 TaxID=2785524 RepID=UPI0018A03A91|nr:TonB-dependent receptor [Glaciecola sp. MH2013]MBF7073642.1 TonB-dependent receptor [Glaciecola sp. MH2013]